MLSHSSKAIFLLQFFLVYSAVAQLQDHISSTVFPCLFCCRTAPRPYFFYSFSLFTLLSHSSKAIFFLQFFLVYSAVAQLLLQFFLVYSALSQHQGHISSTVFPCLFCCRTAPRPYFIYSFSLFTLLSHSSKAIFFLQFFLVYSAVAQLQGHISSTVFPCLLCCRIAPRPYFFYSFSLFILLSHSSKAIFLLQFFLVYSALSQLQGHISSTVFPCLFCCRTAPRPYFFYSFSLFTLLSHSSKAIFFLQFFLVYSAVAQLLLHFFLVYSALSQRQGHISSTVFPCLFCSLTAPRPYFFYSFSLFILLSHSSKAIFLLQFFLVYSAVSQLQGHIFSTVFPCLFCCCTAPRPYFFYSFSLFILLSHSTKAIFLLQFFLVYSAVAQLQDHISSTVFPCLFCCRTAPRPYFFYSFSLFSLLSHSSKAIFFLQFFLVNSAVPQLQGHISSTVFPCLLCCRIAPRPYFFYSFSLFILLSHSSKAIFLLQFFLVYSALSQLQGHISSTVFPHYSAVAQLLYHISSTVYPCLFCCRTAPRPYFFYSFSLFILLSHSSKAIFLLQSFLVYSAVSQLQGQISSTVFPCLFCCRKAPRP